MGNNVSQAFFHVFSEKDNSSKKKSSKEFCKMIEDNVRRALSMKKNECQFIFYDTKFSKTTIDDAISNLQQKGILVEILENKNNNDCNLNKTSLKVNVKDEYIRAYEQSRMV